MHVDTKPVVPAQPRSLRGIIRAADLPIPAMLRDARPPNRVAVARFLVLVRGLLARLLKRVWRSASAHRASVALFTSTSALYIAVGVLLALHYGRYAGDAQSRLANAYYVLFSRDPHLGAIGFVWNPLPSMAMMPLLLFKGLWPELVSRAFAANIMSAFFMAGSVLLVHNMAKDFRLRRGARLAVTLAFALQPIVVLYGGNGMSEAMFIFFLLLTCRRLSRWLETGQLWDLVLGSSALALAYLTRVEAVAPAMAATAVVVAVSLLRSTGEMRGRLRLAALHGFLFAAPAAFAFIIWATISWVITGHPFEQFSSQYGNASQLAARGEAFEIARGGLSRAEFVGYQLLGLAAALPLVLLAASWTAGRRRDLRLLAPLSLLGGVVMFQVLAYLRGMTAGNLRYLITMIPMVFVLLACALLRPADAPGRWRWVRGGLAVGLIAVVGVTTGIGSVLAMSDTRIGREEAPIMSFLRDPGADQLGRLQAQGKAIATMSAYIDSLELPRGALVVDNFDVGSVCTPLMILGSERPKQFVIPNDRDFKPILADPVTFGASYLFVPNPGDKTSINEINRTYPTLYENGAGIATLAKEFKAAGCPSFRLYRLNARAS